MSAAGALNVGIHSRRLQFAQQHLRAGDKRSVLVEETYAVVPVVMAWLLVGDESGDKYSAVVASLQQSAQHTVFRDRSGVETLAQIEPKPVEPLVAQRAVDL